MRIRKRLAAGLAAAMSLAGLTFIATTVVAPSASAHPAPATGTHTVQRACDDGAYHSTVNFTYNLTGPTYTAPDGSYSYYTFSLLTATYTGTVGLPNPSRGPQIVVNSQIGSPDQQFPLNATVGGYNSTLKYPFSSSSYPSTHAVAPTTTNNFVTGSNGAPWTSFTIISRPKGVAQLGRVFWFSAAPFTHPSCADGSPDEYWDLAFPEKPQEGEEIGILNCPGNETTGASSMQLNYEVTPQVGDNFNVHMQSAIFTSEADVTEEYYTDSKVELISGSNTTLMGEHLMSLNRDGNTSFGESDFTDASFEYVDGITKPFLRWTTYSTALGGFSCSKDWYLGNEWNLPGHDYTNTTNSAFDDCSVSHAGNVSIKTWWREDNNSEKVRLERIQIANTSDARLVMASFKPSTMTPNPLIRADEEDLSVYLVTLMSASSANRILAPHETRDLPVSVAFWWDNVNAPDPIPSQNYFYKDQVPVVEITFNAFKPNGTGWLACPEAQTQLNNLEGTSLRL